MQDQGTWDDCPAGAVTEMAGRLRRRRRQTQLLPFIFVGAALLLSAIGYGLTNRTPGSQGEFNCRETVPLLAKFHAQKLDAAAANHVREHLSHCPKCRKHYEALYPSEAQNRSSAETGPLALSRLSTGLLSRE